MAAPNLLADPTKPTTFSALFKHISPPTAVDHCLYCHLTNPITRNLVVTRGCFIDIYTLKENGSGKMHLNWIATSCVYEDIVDIVSVHFVGDRLDSLLLSFTEAKVAVMGFDPVQYELKTLSLHNYEFENLKSGRTHFSHLPILRVDPLQRCAVVLVYDRHLAVLPFRRSEALAAGDKYLAKPVTNNTTRGAGSLSWERRATAPLLATFTTCLSSSTGEKINNVLDMQFLNGFYEPTLLVLYEPIGTWAGVSARRDTCCIVALSFNLQKRTNPVIWFQESLPYDCTYVHSVPEPIVSSFFNGAPCVSGGVLILATNSIIYMKQTLPSCGLPLNCYAQVTTNFPMRQDVPQCGPLTLDGCRIVTMTDSQFLIVTRTGKMCLLSLWVEHTTQTVSSLLLHEIGCSVPPYSVALLDKGYVFVGSRLCDSVLLHLTASTMFVNTLGRIVDLDETTTADNRTTDIPMIERDTESIPVDKNNPAEKVAENASSETPTKPSGSIVHGPYVFDEVDVELYGDTILNPPSDVRELNTYKFEVADRLVNFGPMGLLTSGEVPCLAPGNTDPTDEALIAAQAEMHHVELLACIPRSFEDVKDFTKDLRAGGVMLLHTSVRPRGLTAFELPEYMSLWSLYGPPIMSPVPQKPIKVEEVAEDERHSKPDSVLESTAQTTEDPVEENSLASNNEAISNSLTVTQSAPEEPSITTELTKVNDSHEPVKVEFEGPSRSSKGTSSTPSIKRCQGQTHSYLLLTREDSTMILEVSHEIVELEVSGFNTTEMTVTAVNLGGVYIETMQKDSVAHSPSLDQGVERSTTETNNLEPMELADKRLRVGHDYPYILQVSPTSLRLLDGPQLIEYVQVTLEWRIHLASSADPYVLLCTEDDELVLIRLRPPDAVDAALPASRMSYKKPSFLDLRAAMEESEVEHHAKRNRDPSVPFTSTTRLEVFRPKVGQPLPQLTTSDEEDLILYGQLIELCKRERPEVFPTGDVPPAQAMDTGIDVDDWIPPTEEENIPPTVLEITVFPIGRNRDRPVRTSQEIAFFEALCPSHNEAHPFASESWSQEGLRWRRLPIPCPLVAPRRVRTDPKIADVQTYALVGTRVKPCSSVYHLNAEGNKEEEVLLRPPTCVLPSLDYYVLQMYAPSTGSAEATPWQAIPHACIDFEPWEVVTCMITAQLSSEQTFHGTKDYLALGANLSYGEEIPVRGRIIILDVIDVVPEPGQPLTRHKLKTIYDGEQKVTDERGNVVIYSYDPLEPSSRSGRRLVRRADMCLPTRAISSLRVANRLRHALLSVKSAGTGTQNTVPPAAGVGGSEVPERTERQTTRKLRGTSAKKLSNKLISAFCGNYRPSAPELVNPSGQVADADLLWRYLTLPHSQRLEIAKKSGQSLEG
ncbi:CPSF A subunit region, partial [Opisthorchis viverrini]